MNELRKKCPDMEIEEVHPVFEKARELHDFLALGETSTGAKDGSATAGSSETVGAENGS